MRAWRLAVAVVGLAAVASAAEVGGIRVDERTSLGASELVLNGAGLRKQAFFRVYVAGLYLTEKRTSPQDVLALSGPKRVSITLLRNLATRQLVDALRDGIRKNSSPEEQRAVEGRIDGVLADVLAVPQGRKGDVFTVDWLPDAGTLVALNGEVKSHAIPGEDVYRAFLKVWLGDNPTSAGLRKRCSARLTEGDTMATLTKLSYGGTAAIVTGMGLIVGFDAATASKATLVGSLLLIAVADINLADSLAIHAYQESERLAAKQAFRSTVANSVTRFLVAASFLILVLALPTGRLTPAALAWGMALLGTLTYFVARDRGVAPLPEVAKHLAVALVVIVVSRAIGSWILARIGG